ncbi:hypothetical protein PVAND_008836 [Polypedilum vanderplanki]|uniref:Secreted protein n=1 Tax=Polypedilum vanderplanki TaxID=319348 RepID=A0A9J6CBL3_POLVA|nr:hypothetical protein PVAND_008836 [Polypedilum vanderplanki]
MEKVFILFILTIIFITNILSKPQVTTEKLCSVNLSLIKIPCSVTPQPINDDYDDDDDDNDTNLKIISNKKCKKDENLGRNRKCRKTTKFPNH